MTDRRAAPAAPCRRRRSLLLGIPGAALFAAGLRGALADPLEGAVPGMTDAGPPNLRHPTLLVAGPADAPPGLWARLLAPRLAQALELGSAIPVSATGGRDGVTGANAFEALSNPDGSTAMLVPGSAAIAWLAGDPRVHFDAGRWVPALASLSSGVLVGRDRPAGLDGQVLRTAASTVAGPELPALLGLSLLGADPAPVFGLSQADDAARALADGRVDAVFLTGHDVPQRLKRLADAGFAPIFSLGGSDEDPMARDPAAPAASSFAERFHRQNGQAPSGPLFEAFRATAAAARLDVALVLPMLAPPSLVARWRTACEAALSDLGLVAAARRAQVAAVPAPECVQALARMNADQTTQISLRRWIAARPEWNSASVSAL